eukprot:TRINITY_DN11055_c0_g2_i1.p1 TRINITY_DN11055_c0_g2~~TRINITY_DN11055_c0_g2_i1.p1  ORF type:complete len:391 (+),score=130.96 TRINITY_DN11055_c0_g2_i1:180-1352(+)
MVTRSPVVRSALRSAFDFDFYDTRVADYAATDAVSLPLQNIISWYDSGRIEEENVIESAQYVHRELPVRLAKTLNSFEALPLLVLKQPAMHTAFRLYMDSFDMLTQLEVPHDLASAERFTLAVDSRSKDTAHLLSLLSEGLSQARGKLRGGEVERLDDFTHLFIGHRLARRMLASNHCAMVDHYQEQEKEGLTETEVGIFHRAAPVNAIVSASAEEAQGLCMAEYGQYPEIQVSDPSGVNLFCVPANLQAVLVEVLKNSMKATVERHMTHNVLPEVHATITAAANGTVLIQLEDQGGGMSSESEASLWRYGASGKTLLDGKKKGDKDEGPRESIFGIRDIHTKRLSGYGFGLPLSKARANYFGGDLWLRNMEYYGTDTYIRMPPATSRWL